MKFLNYEGGIHLLAGASGWARRLLHLYDREVECVKNVFDLINSEIITIVLLQPIFEIF